MGTTIEGASRILPTSRVYRFIIVTIFEHIVQVDGADDGRMLSARLLPGALEVALHKTQSVKVSCVSVLL